MGNRINKIISNLTFVAVAVLFVLLGLTTYPVFVGGTAMFKSRITGKEVLVTGPEAGVDVDAKEFKEAIEKRLLVRCKDEDELHAVVEVIKEHRQQQDKTERN